MEYFEAIEGAKKMNQVVSILERDGILHVNKEITSHEYESIAKSLGPILDDFPVKIDRSVTKYVCGSDPVPFHNDDVSCRYVSWHCIEQDGHDGDSLLIRTKDIFSFLSYPELEALSRVRIEFPPYGRRNVEAARTHLLLQDFPANPGIAYVPWLKTHSPDEVGENAVLKLKSIMGQIEKSDRVIKIRLRPGHALFIDNWRVLHGRGAIHSTSPRHLRRFWIGAIGDPSPLFGRPSSLREMD